MDAEDYHKFMLAEVNVWEVKLKIMNEMTAFGTSVQNEMNVPFIGQPDHMVASAQMRLDQSQNGVPPDWSPLRTETENFLGTLGRHVDPAWDDLAPDEGEE